MKMNKKQLLILGSVIIGLVLLIGGGVLLFGKKKENENKPNDGVTDNTIVQDVSPEKAQGMYDDLVKDCTGALVFNMAIGEEVDISGLDSASLCKNDDHYSKLFGYTYDEFNNLIMHVKLLKKVDNDLYNLEDEKVGVYDENNLNQLLDYGSTYVYTYQKQGDNYTLSKVSYAPPVESDNDTSND